MRAARLLPFLLAILVLSSPAGTAVRPASPGAPRDLHAFLLRVDEPRSETFSRTPSFGWGPVPGATGYEFQLSTSSVFRESGIVYSTSSLTSPVAAPPLTLPWITGSPHSLYARVRAVLGKGTTAWSEPFGFDSRPHAPPAPLPSYPGLLRWTPVDGAGGYQVWLVDLSKIVNVFTNVLDEREFYTFHQAPSWVGQVRWRIRAIRVDVGGRMNGLPAVTYGAWSPTYSSVNPSSFGAGPLKPLATISDVVSRGTSSSPAHRLMPAFVFSGDQTLAGTSAELYRVYVFTDRSCLNRVFTGAIVGGPAYAPRPYGPLALPRSAGGIVQARSSYLPDGDEGTSFTFDLASIGPTESLAPATPTTGLPSGSGQPSSSPPVGSQPGGSPPGGSPPSGSQSGGTPVPLVTVSGNMGAPVDLWDTEWPSGGYYWTIVPVEAKVPDAISTAVASPGAAGAASSLPVASAAGFAIGDVIVVGNSSNQETVTVTSVSGNTIGLATPLKVAHGIGEPVTRTSGNIQYRDLELPQDACAAGRVMRFGKESEPALTSGGDLFASGLSPTGRLTSARRTAAFYRAPLVAWTTALGAEVYEVQWSKTRYPFVPEPDPKTGALGMMTATTSAILPLRPGTWYYRVRGFDFSLPTGSQAMSWSDRKAIVVTKPKFAVLSG